jgi:predicted transposase/invertase (TIGR01784 family)
MAKTKNLRVLNDFAFKKIFGEKGDEVQLISLLNSILKRTGKDHITSIEIVENKELPADFLGGKASKLDVRAILDNIERANIEIQLKNEYNMEKRSLRYWAQEYTKGIVEGQDYIDLPPVIVINILDFGYIPLDDFHTSFHLYEDRHKEYMLTDALEMHYIDMVRWRKLKKKDYSEPINRWMAYFDEQSPPELVEEVLKMDMAIQTAQSRLEMIKSDPELAHAYDMYEQTRIDYKFGIQGARQDGEQNKAIEIARNLKAIGISVGQIAQATGLSADEIAKL